jgi:hypothetical protein
MLKREGFIAGVVEKFAETHQQQYLNRTSSYAAAAERHVIFNCYFCGNCFEHKSSSL